MRPTSDLRQRSRRLRRSLKPRPAHHWLAALARATASATSLAEATGTRPTSWPVAGLVEISSPPLTVLAPGFVVTVTAEVYAYPKVIRKILNYARPRIGCRRCLRLGDATFHGI